MLKYVLILAGIILIHPLVLPRAVSNAINTCFTVCLIFLPPMTAIVMLMLICIQTTLVPYADMRRNNLIRSSPRPNTAASNDIGSGLDDPNHDNHTQPQGTISADSTELSIENNNHNRLSMTEKTETYFDSDEWELERSTAPLWMPPSRTEDWKRIPLVPYESYHEYQTLLESTRKKYARMIEGVLLYVKNSNIHGMTSTLMPWSLSHYGFLRSVTKEWIKQGEQVLLRFTKGIGRDWCTTVSINIATRLNTAVRVFVMNSPLFESARTSMAQFEEYQEEILDFVRDEITHYMSEYDLNPYDRGYTLNSVNFVHYVPSNTSTSDPFLILRTMDENLGMIPVRKFQEIMLAFATGIHPCNSETQGAVPGEKKSHVRMLTDDLLRIIFRHDIFYGNHF